MRISIRELVKELLEDESLIVNYNELKDGGFDLSIRINEEALNKAEAKIDDTIKSTKPTCPYCGSKEVFVLYGTINCDGSGDRMHYMCDNCRKEFEIEK